MAKSGMPAKRGPGRPKGSKSTGRRVRRSSADVEEVAEQVLGYVRAYPGQRLEEIGRGLGTDTAGLKLPVKELVASGRLRTEGQKRGTKYFAGGRSRAVKAKAKAQKGSRRKAGQRGKRKAMRQVAMKPATKGRRPAKRKATAATLSAVAESAAAT